jgi:glycerol-3-phosphate dehydrogenase
VAVADLHSATSISDDETQYLLDAVNRYLDKRLTRSDIVWSYAGVRPLYDDGQADPSAITRDYVLKTDHRNGALPLLSVFGGKLTTYRKLAEHALAELKPYFPAMGAAWTANETLPGGNLNGATPSDALRAAQSQYTILPPDTIAQLFRRHGTRIDKVLEGVHSANDLGQRFGDGAHALTEREIDYCITHEWARTTDDILWRRTKCGLHLDATTREQVSQCVATKLKSR